MAEKQHSLRYENGLLTVCGVMQVISISEKEAEFKLENGLFVVRGSGLNVTRLDKEQGVVALEAKAVSSMTYRNGGFNLKGLLR